jgi:hypothetical protein
LGQTGDRQRIHVQVSGGFHIHPVALQNVGIGGADGALVQRVELVNMSRLLVRSALGEMKKVAVARV